MALTQVQGQMLAGATSTSTPIQVGGSTVATFTSTGLGIGTTNPTFPLTISAANPRMYVGASPNTGYTVTQYNNSSGNFWIGIDDSTGSGYFGVPYACVLYGGNAYPMIFGTNSTERMRILSDGAIGFGTTTWGGANGISMSNASDSASYGKSMLFNSPYNGTRNAINFQYNSSQVGTIVTGTSSTSYNSGSDYRLKDNPQPLTGSGAFIDALQPKTWTWKIDGKKGVGFIAHEVQEISPDSVFGEKDAVDENGKPIIQTMEYGSSEFIANMIAELQDLRKRVAALEAK